MRQPKDTSAPSALDQFLDIAGHELRIPITALKGQVQLMQRRLRRESGRERDLVDLDKMAYQVERLTLDVDIYLAAAHIAEHRLKVHPEPADIVAVLARLVGIFSAGTAGHAVRFECAFESLPGMLDKRRVEQVGGILLANALKYSPDGEVVVCLGAQGDIARVEVLDRGVGVPARERARIFQRYTHGSNVENSGAGLGLYVARELVRRQGGRIGVRPRSGGGSVFWFELPLHPMHRSVDSSSDGASAAPAAENELADEEPNASSPAEEKPLILTPLSTS